MTTNTDINELARQLREAAKTSLSAPEFGSSDVAGITRLRLMKPFVDLSRPKNILALLDALEAAQLEVEKRKNHAIFVRDSWEENIELKKRIAELEASQPVAPEGYCLVPLKATQAHLNSIAMRYRHDFYLLNENERDSALSVARQMYSECTGQGFYSIPAAPALQEGGNELA